MAANELRDTPGRLLLGWALLLSCLVLLAWRIHLHPTDYEWTEYPTALGDVKYYTALGQEDRYEPNLRFPGQEKGLYRRSVDAVVYDDATMLKLALDATGRHLVYQRAQFTPRPRTSLLSCPSPAPCYPFQTKLAFSTLPKASRRSASSCFRLAARPST
ncbi:MAG: hypothetical protein LW645_15385 [Verrucomicrobiaceae bacterium]|nr:hypothetical protein [Verrucomicrobiaceae bacterium]